MCENARAPFSSGNFSHVDAISSELSRRIRLLAILRGERSEFYTVSAGLRLSAQLIGSDASPQLAGSAEGL
jgi:hypothetical protein